MEEIFNQLLQQMRELTEQLQQQSPQLQQQTEQLTELQEIIAAKDAQIAALTARIEELTHKKNSGKASAYIASLNDDAVSKAFHTIDEQEWLESVKDHLSKEHKGSDTAG